MITKETADYLDVAESGYKSVGGTTPLDRSQSWLPKLAQLSEARDILPVELGMAIYYYDQDALLADIPSTVAYLMGAMEMLRASSPRRN